MQNKLDRGVLLARPHNKALDQLEHPPGLAEGIDSQHARIVVSNVLRVLGPSLAAPLHRRLSVAGMLPVSRRGRA